VLVERLGVTVAMVQGLGQNLKITTPEDLQTARAWAAPRRRG
jgi:2-C-methyl-D-erythritol 4-phosphate cytidylyltransferase